MKNHKINVRVNLLQSMSNSIFKIALTIVVVVVSYSCAETKTNRELFDESLEKNIAAGIRPLIDKGVDSIAARNCISCLLETMYQIDSTYFLKELNEQKEIYLKNEAKFQECEFYLLPAKDSLLNDVKSILRETGLN